MDKQATLDALQSELGDRASTVDVRRIVYSHDMGTLPDVVRKFIDTMPAMVVQPETADEVRRIAVLARDGGLPLVPRGSASAGYGGAVPAASGVVVDMYRMRGLLSLDADASCATALPATTLEELDAALREAGFRMPLMPTSAPSATIGGFVCQGGSGIGGAREKTMRDNLVAVTAVLGDGSVRTFTGEDLDLVYGMEGITGIVTEVTFRIVPAAEERVRAFSFADATAAQVFAHGAVEAGAWHVSVLPPNYLALTNRAIGSALPEAWVVMVADEAREGGVAAPAGCVILLLLSKLRFVHPALRAFCVCEAWVVSLPSARSACC